MKMVLSVPLRYFVHTIKPLAAEQPTEHSSLWEAQNPARTAVAAYKVCIIFQLVYDMSNANWENVWENAFCYSTGEEYSVDYRQSYSQDI